MCDVCRKTICDNRCPNKKVKKRYNYCSHCGEDIQDGEEYVVNDDNEHIHYSCVTTREMIHFLGYKVRIMDDENY